MGKCGLKKLAEICAQKAHYASTCIAEIEGFSLCFTAPFFNEFAVSCPVPPKDINNALLKKGIIGGFNLGRFYSDHENSLLLCVTETTPKEDIEGLVSVLKEVVP
jgi:glycine dehydrogenase subunit 1